MQLILNCTTNVIEKSITLQPNTITTLTIISQKHTDNRHNNDTIIIITARWCCYHM